jgi:hypothetical protein
LKYRDEYSRKSGHAPDKLLTKKQNTETDKETDHKISPSTSRKKKPQGGSDEVKPPVEDLHHPASPAIAKFEASNPEPFATDEPNPGNEKSDDQG